MTTVKKITQGILKSLNETAEPVAVKESYSEEIARELFVSLIKLGYGAYSILNDGYFVEKIYADSDEEAIKKFYEIIKKRKSGPMVYPEDEIDAAEDGDVIQYTEGVGIKLKDIGVVLVEGTLNAQKPIKSQVEALNVAEYKRSLKLAKTVSESIVLKRITEAVSLDEVADKLNAAGVFAKNIVNKGLNLAVDGTQYGVQLVGEKDGQVKVAVVAKRGGKLLDLTSKANADDVTKTILSLLNKTGEPSKKKSIFMKADEAFDVNNGLSVSTYEPSIQELKYAITGTLLDAYSEVENDDGTINNYYLILNDKSKKPIFSVVVCAEDFSSMIDENDINENTPDAALAEFEHATEYVMTGHGQAIINSFSGQEFPFAPDDFVFKWFKRAIADNDNESIMKVDESAGLKPAIQLTQEMIEYDNAYANELEDPKEGKALIEKIMAEAKNLGFSGIYNIYDYGTSVEVSVYANQEEYEKDRDDGREYNTYGFLGGLVSALNRDLQSDKPKWFGNTKVNNTVDPKQLNIIKDMIRDYLYYGETLNTFIAQDYPIVRGMSKDELRAIWRECMSELEEL